MRPPLNIEHNMRNLSRHRNKASKRGSRQDSEARSVRRWHSQRSREGSEIKPSGEGQLFAVKGREKESTGQSSKASERSTYQLSRGERSTRQDGEIKQRRGDHSHPSSATRGTHNLSEAERGRRWDSKIKPAREGIHLFSLPSSMFI
jgi:hypothetical protein